ncbi:hypothetical protein EON63_12335 [archaeon]|nr:MAG: hypothetical protein EON63_12335 [archaeon]
MGSCSNFFSKTTMINPSLYPPRATESMVCCVCVCMGMCAMNHIHYLSTGILTEIHTNTYMSWVR